MNAINVAVLWDKLNEAGLLSGAWSGLKLDEVPDEVQADFHKAIMKAVSNV